MKINRKGLIGILAILLGAGILVFLVAKIKNGFNDIVSAP